MNIQIRAYTFALYYWYSGWCYINLQMQYHKIHTYTFASMHHANIGPVAIMHAYTHTHTHTNTHTHTH